MTMQLFEARPSIQTQSILQQMGFNIHDAANRDSDPN